MAVKVLSIGAGLHMTKHPCGETTLCLTATLDEKKGEVEQNLAILRDFAKELSQKQGRHVELNVTIFCN